jgi:tetratricopeptide (TPR) repeat protein
VIERDLAQASEILTGLIREDPTNPAYRLALAQAERHRFMHFAIGDRRDEALASFQTARETLEKLVAEFPRDPQYRMELADTLSLAGTRRIAIPEEEAEQHLERGIELCQQLAAAFPSVQEYQALLATAYRNLAKIQRSRGRLEDAEHHFSLAKEKLEMLVGRYPAHAFYPLTLARTSLGLAEIKLVLGVTEGDPVRLQESRDVLDQALSRLAKDERRDKPWHRETIAALYRTLASVHRTSGDDAAADEAAQQANDLEEPLRGPFIRPGPPPRL